jgi:hypothetical protein
MEMSQGNTLYSYLKQKNVILFYEYGQQKSRTDSVWGIGTSGRGRILGKGEYGANIVYTCM